MIKIISNLGDSALYCDFGEEVTKESTSELFKNLDFNKDGMISYDGF